jgi:hypothetical protein
MKSRRPVPVGGNLVHCPAELAGGWGAVCPRNDGGVTVPTSGLNGGLAG